MDAGPQPEGVHPPGVGRGGQRECQIGNEVKAVRPRRVLKGHERVCGEPEELRRRVVLLVEGGIDRGAKSEQRERPASVRVACGARTDP